MTNEQLVSLIKDGIDVSDNMLQLWEQNRGFINKMALSYRGCEEIEDLEQQGYLGLCQAVDKYDPDEDVPFINYAAFWIRQSMMQYIDNYGSVVRIPSYKQQKQNRYKKFVHDFERQTGRKPTGDETCYYMGIDSGNLEDIQNSIITKQIGSLDSYISEDDNMTVGDSVPADMDVESSVLDEIEREELKNIIWPMVDDLPEEQGQVIHLLYREGKTLKYIGELLGVPGGHVQGIKQKALRELRKSKRKKELYAFLPEVLGSMAYGHNGLGEFNCTWTSSTELTALRMY